MAFIWNSHIEAIEAKSGGGIVSWTPGLLVLYRGGCACVIVTSLADVAFHV